MAGAIIRKGDDNWNRLITIWRQNGKQSYLVVSPEHYRVMTPSDSEDDVSFVPFGGIDGRYGDTTAVPGAK